MDQEFSKLSYKELQALAVKHQIPGNIKKNMLVDILGALRCGDELQVRRILIELKENRKRKVRKRKLEKMTAVTSTPLHSPNYSSIDDRFYSPQHLSPYHWAPPEEEIMRDDPHYEIFRQYLIQRIQKSYQNLDANNNDVAISSAALNLKADAIESNSRLNVLATCTSNQVVTSSIHQGYPSGGQVESQNLNNSNEDNYKPMILQKMLQAPLGTNLGAMARFEANRMWSSENFRSPREMWENNSETLTAGSESNDETNWVERTDYYNQNQLPQFTLEQMMNFFQTSNQNGAGQHSNQLSYAPPSIQENCQSWIENNSVDYRGPTENVETTDSAARMYASSYSGMEQANYQNPANGSFPVLEQPYGVVANSSQVTGVQAQNMNSYHHHHQWPAQQSQSYRADYYEQTNLSNVFVNNIPPFNANVTQQFSTLQNQDCNQYGMFYPQECATSSHSSAEQFQYMMYHQNQNYNQPVHSLVSNLAQTTYVNQAADRNNNLRPTGSGVQKEGNNFLDPYWPKWSDNNNSGRFRLENMLNLQAGSGAIDYSKVDHTSTVYCFAPPLVSQMSDISSSQHVERAELVTAKRQHTFAPNSLVYNDSTTGRKMAKLTSEITQRSERTGSDESIITLEYLSDDSHHQHHHNHHHHHHHDHHEPIQEIWIRDYSNHHENDSNDLLSSSYETIPE